MSSSVKWLTLFACLAGALVVGCGGDKKDPVDNSKGTGVFLPGQWHLRVTTSGQGNAAICSLGQLRIETADTVACSIPELLANQVIGIEDLTCTTIDTSSVMVDCSATIPDGEGCDITFDIAGGGNLYSDRGTLTLIAAIASLSDTSACDNYKDFPCQSKIVIEATRTGEAPAGRCAPQVSRGPAGLLGVAWDELKPLAR